MASLPLVVGQDLEQGVTSVRCLLCDEPQMEEVTSVRCLLCEEHQTEGFTSVRCLLCQEHQGEGGHIGKMFVM